MKTCRAFPESDHSKLGMDYIRLMVSQDFFTFDRLASWLHPIMKAVGRLAAIGLLFLAGCLASPSTKTVGSGTFGPGSGNAPPPTGEVIGDGDVRVALLLPLSAEGQASKAALDFRNAAELAIFETEEAARSSNVATPGITLLIKDTAGTSEGAVAAARSAIYEQAEIILGPVFAAELDAIDFLARDAKIPVIAFSTNEALARPGTYLMSFMPREDITRIVNFAVSQEKQSFAALFPRDDYGQVAEAIFRQSVAEAGGRVLAIETYEPSKESWQTAVDRIAVTADQIDAVFIPDGSAIAGKLVQRLKKFSRGNKKLTFLGSSRWNSDKQNTALIGAWFPAPMKSKFEIFSENYRTKYGVEPNRLASLPYDAVRITVALVASGGSKRFSRSTLTNADGFFGADGVFRFRRNGTSQRGLAVYTKTKDDIKQISAAPTTFEPPN